ncbi:hypothetical protein Ddye_005013 [Dipteronia dyeriana]|uniref:Microtubule-associated protein futsch n=1 Tax=Dipteronia dyeriana TaxID=168575 RepID=A0AAE0CP81_9ROSI|nr:hypothetical protein Ddye_005013 [Dipteronia dyeriana]
MLASTKQNKTPFEPLKSSSFFQNFFLFSFAMDFRSLTRKELQVLCKNNKIPANITNVAMADALTALDIVEGLEEILKQSQLPEKAVPRTANRTATRRKPIKEEPETAQPTTSTRRTTRKAIEQDLDLENKNVTLVHTPAALASTRRAPAASARSKVEAGSVQQGVYSTRQSVRLLEKTMEELSLKERVMPVPVKMEVFDETEERDVSGNLEKTNGFSSSVSLIEAPKFEMELKDDIQEEDNCADDNDTSEESDEMGTIDVPVTEFTSETENPSADVYDEIPAKDNKADESGYVQVSVSESPSETENASVEMMESDECSPKVAADQKDLEVLPEGEDMVDLPFDPKSCWETESDKSDTESDASNVFPIDANVGKESVQFDNVQLPHGSEELNVEMEESDFVDNSPKSAKQTSSNEPLGDIRLSNSEIDSISEDKAVSYAEDLENNLVDVYVMPANEVDSATNLPPLPATRKQMSPYDPANEVDSRTNLPQLPATPPSGKQMSPYDPANEVDSETNLPPLPATPPSGKQLSPYDPVSGGETQMSHMMGAETMATQFPRPTLSFSKKQTTEQKPTHLPADNKENISGIKVETKKDKGMKMKDKLNDKSMRQLTKLYKEKLHLQNNMKNNDDQVADKAREGKTRPALQTLPENVQN